MIEDHNIITGRVAETLPQLKQRLNGYLSTYDRVKIGATTDPQTRWRLGHRGDGWTKMVLVYCSDFAGSTRSMEKYLIAHARSTRFRVRRENVLPGGESIYDGHDAYFVYVLVA